MDRLKRSVLKSAGRTSQITDSVPPVTVLKSASVPSLQVHPNIGGLGISNSALGDAPDAALPICVTTLGDEVLMQELGEVRAQLSLEGLLGLCTAWQRLSTSMDKQDRMGSACLQNAVPGCAGDVRTGFAPIMHHSILLLQI
jgi:hypothetical protein